jgi:plasmid replication initiation protein
MSVPPLLPERHPNQDFFIPDIFDALPFKGDRHTMEHPFFTLSTKPDFRTVEYHRDGVSITLTPHATLGLPTMMDKDILLYCGSLLMAEINKGHIPPRTLRFSAYDLMVTTNRHTNDVGYRMLDRAFKRLTGALMSTNIQTNGVEERANFHILDASRVIKSSRDGRRMVQLEVTLSNWFYNALVGKEVLTINRDYFRLRKTLERRLYELARKHCGHQPSWAIGMENLREKCGSQSPLKKFRYQLRQIAATNHVPDYRLSVGDDDKVVFRNEESLPGQPELPGLNDLPRLTRQTLQRGRELVAASRSGWDFNALHTQFTEQLTSGRFKPGNVNGAFINFLKKKLRERP